MYLLITYGRSSAAIPTYFSSPCGALLSGNPYDLFRFILVLAACLGLWSVSFAAEPDPRVQPGASFTISFPELAKDRHGNETQIEVRIPTNYSPNRLVPLLAWMGGGDGDNKGRTSEALVDKTTFVRIGLPFPKGANNPGQSNMVGNFPVMWEYYKAILARLETTIPNIHLAAHYCRV